MYERINERIAVYAIFRNTNPLVTPVAIIWRGKRRIITKVGYVYKYKEGAVLLHVVAVTDGVNFYELVFNAYTLAWELGRVEINDRPHKKRLG